jgi:hypothetical protein
VAWCARAARLTTEHPTHVAIAGRARPTPPALRSRWLHSGPAGCTPVPPPALRSRWLHSGPAACTPLLAASFVARNAGLPDAVGVRSEAGWSEVGERYSASQARSLCRPGFGLWLWSWGEVAFDFEVGDPAEPGGEVPVPVAEQHHGAGQDDASSSRATATPKPICWNMTRSPRAKPQKTATMMSAAPVMIRAVEATPQRTAAAVSATWS